MLLDTPKGKTGWQAPDFTLNDFDGTPHRMTDYIGKGGLVVAFICNHCPYVQGIVDRLASDAHALMDEGIGVLAVMSNDIRFVPEDAPPHMKKFAAQNGFRFPYLFDGDQSIAKSFGAVCTPDFFGLNSDGALQYRGRLDSAGMNDPTGRTADLVLAMRQIAQTGAGPQVQHPSMGCSIKWS